MSFPCHGRTGGACPRRDSSGRIIGVSSFFGRIIGVSSFFADKRTDTNNPGIVLDDVLPAVTPCHDMIDGIGILDPQSSCHHPIESSCHVSFNKKF